MWATFEQKFSIEDPLRVVRVLLTICCLQAEVYSSRKTLL